MAGFYRFAWAAAGVFLCLFAALPCIAQDAAGGGTAAAAAPPEVSRQEWLDRVRESRKRAREDAQNRRLHPERYAPTQEEEARAASERVLNDDSLQPGDIVSTDRGLFVFRGTADQPPKSEDFVPWPNR
jgi:hypothetical protein